MKHRPFLKHVKVSNIVLDVLHILLRVTDRLLSLAILEIFRLKKKDSAAIECIEKAMGTILRSWNFFVRAEQGAGKSWNAKYGYTTLRGPEKLILLKNFRLVALQLYPDDIVRADWLSAVWDQLAEIYSYVNDSIQNTKFYFLFPLSAP